MRWIIQYVIDGNREIEWQAHLRRGHRTNKAQRRDVVGKYNELYSVLDKELIATDRNFFGREYFHSCFYYVIREHIHYDITDAISSVPSRLLVSSVRRR